VEGSIHPIPMAFGLHPVHLDDFYRRRRHRDLDPPGLSEPYRSSCPNDASSWRDGGVYEKQRLLGQSQRTRKSEHCRGSNDFGLHDRFLQIERRKRMREPIVQRQAGVVRPTK
jgi:hypothetical protein